MQHRMYETENIASNYYYFSQLQLTATEHYLYILFGSYAPNYFCPHSLLPVGLMWDIGGDLNRGFFKSPTPLANLIVKSPM